MGLGTRWFFLLPASNEAEDRHIYDVAFGIRVLLQKRIRYEDIVVFIDRYSKAKLEAVFSEMKIPLPSKIYAVDELCTVLDGNIYRNAVVFVTGHGSSRGLDSTPPITPYELYEKFQCTANFRRVVFYFGQCYAGIFDYMPLSTHLGLNEHSKCKMVAIGSTGLSTSISMPIKIDGIKWVANIFLLYVFLWILDSKDVDGDGKFTVMDSFKAATINTNRSLQKQKKQEGLQTIPQYIMLVACIQKLSEKDTPDSDKDNIYLEKLALEKKLEQAIGIYQMPWILNATIAMSTEF